MTEYVREQRKQESRVIANSGVRSSQFKDIIDNRRDTVFFHKQAFLFNNHTLNENLIQRSISYTTYSVKTDSEGRGILASVQGLRGKTEKDGTNSPSVNPPGWRWLSGNGYSNFWVRMHLWNGRLGGPGDQIGNLTPGPKKANSSMYYGGEKGAQEAIDKGHTLDLVATASYAGWMKNPKGAREGKHKISELIPTYMSLKWENQLHTLKGEWDTTRDPDDSFATEYQQILSDKGEEPG